MGSAPVERLIAAVRRALGEKDLPLRAQALDRTGEALAACRLTAEGDPARAWVAKRLHPGLRREGAAYRGPLAGLGVAPRLVAEFEDDEGLCWIVLEDAGRPLTGTEPAAWLEEVAALAARFHALPAGLLRGPLWRRREHVRHGFRHLRGEWRIALTRVEAGVRAGALETDVAPDDAEARRVLDDAWQALRETGFGLVHGDFQPSNILRGEDGALRAVDWSQWGEGSGLLDLASITLDLAEDDRARFLEAYLAARGLAAERTAWREGLARVLPLRQLLGVGVLAHYVVHGLRPEVVAESLPRRLAGWDALRRGGVDRHASTRRAPWS